MSTTDSYSILALAWKTVIRKVFRNVVLMVAVALLVTLLVFAMLFKKAVEEDIEAATKKLGADIVLVPPQAIGVAEEFILESREKTFYMDGAVVETVADLPEVAAATHHVYLNTLESGCCSIVEGQVVAFDPETDFVVKSWLDGPTPALQPGEVYVGSYVYDFLGLINTATLFGHGVKVTGHLKPTGTGLDHGIFMRIADLDQISEEARGKYKPGMVSIVFVKVKAGLDPELVAKKIQGLNPKLGVMTRGSIGGDVRATLHDIMKIFSVTILISSLLAILLAWSTFTAMTNERRREVGILRALGARQSHIIKMFLAEAAIISLLGGVLGILLGHYLIAHLADSFALLTKLGAAATFSRQNILLSSFAAALGLGVCLLGALIPTLRLARLEPLLAIKQE